MNVYDIKTTKAGHGQYKRANSTAKKKKKKFSSFSFFFLLAFIKIDEMANGDEKITDN